MRGDIVFQIFGVHAGRAEDVFFGARRTRAEAEAEIARLCEREMHGENWASRYHDQGFVVREARVETDFEIPTLPKPRDQYVVELTSKPNPGAWSSTRVEVFRRGPPVEKVCEFERGHAMWSTFEPFRQGDRDLALISRDYTRTAVLDLRTGDVIAEEEIAYYDAARTQPGAGFCPVGFYVPDWWDVNDGSIIPGSRFWDADDEWPTGDFGFVWGCYWGDDSSWKVQYLDLRDVQRGVIRRDDRFGEVELVTDGYDSPCFRRDAPENGTRSLPPGFISVERQRDDVEVRFAAHVRFNASTGKATAWERRPDED